MNKRLAIIIAVCAVLAAAVLSTQLYKERARVRNLSATMMESATGFELIAADIHGKTAEVLDAIRENVEVPGRREKIQLYYERAMAITALADSLDQYIDSIKNRLSRLQDGESAVGQAGLDAYELKQKMKYVFGQMMAGQNMHDTGAYYNKLAVERYSYNFGNTPNWEQRTFGSGVTRSAAIMNLARIQADLAGIEMFHIVKLFEITNSGCSLRFSPHGAVVVPRQQILFPGDRYGASIFLLDYDWLLSTDKQVNVAVNGKPVRVVNAIGDYTVTAGAPGIHSFTGKFSIMEKGVENSSYHFRQDYMVVEPGAYVVFDNETHIAAGKETPITVHAVLIPDNRLHVSISRGSITAGKNGHYTIKVDEPGKVAVTLGYKLDGNGYRALDTFYYEVR